MTIHRKNPSIFCRYAVSLRKSSLSWLPTLAVLCLYSFLLGSCQPTTNKASEAPSEFESSKDYFPDKVTISYAKGFSVSYHTHYKVLNIINPFSQQPDTARYILVQRGTPRPKLKPNEQVIEIPIRKMIGSSSAHIALTDFLGANPILVGLGSKEYVSSPEVLKMISEKKIAEVGSGPSLNQELVLSLAPDVLMIVGRSDEKFNTNGVITEAGIGVITNSEWQENTPLAKAEWVKLMAVLLNKEALVNQKFVEIEKKYRELARMTEKVAKRPTVFNGMSFKGAWHVAGGRGYMAQFLKDAGANYLWASDTATGSVQMDFESVYAVAMNADFWVKPSSAKTKADILTNDSRNADFKAFKTGQIYNNNKRVNEQGSNDYWESGVVSPHVILADLIKIFHPELLPQHELVYYQKVAP